jgi:hypothetical protein
MAGMVIMIMMKVIALAAIVLVATVFVSACTAPHINDEETNNSEISHTTEEAENNTILDFNVTFVSCRDTGGTVTRALCCNSTESFPNMCALGACGCSPENSHMVSICKCPEGKCFDGRRCV